jgi:hypothetical protein
MFTSLTLPLTPARGRQAPDLPPDVYDHLTAAENTDQAVAAMRRFVRRGEEAAFEYAVAIYVASARTRQEPIEAVVGALCLLAATLEGPRSENDILLRPTRMHQLIFSGILRAFYGDEAVLRAVGARAQRKADAPQHTKSGTWPRKPAE